MSVVHGITDLVVVVPNWNGVADTIECAQSVLKSFGTGFRLVVVDNGSTDGSVEKLGAWFTGPQGNQVYEGLIEGSGNSFAVYDRETAENGGDNAREGYLSGLPSNRTMIAIDIGENLGFAAGANVGIRYAMARCAKYIWLLNNDTVVDPTAMHRLVMALSESGAAAATAQIRYFDRPSEIWNCGGKLTLFGTRKYSFANSQADRAPSKGACRVTFVTGCAVLLRSDSLKEHGLLTERFFFGEEDVEFAMRMKRAKQTLICVYDSIVYHKIGRSIDTSSVNVLIGKIYINYLNRFINMRQFWPKPIWWLWRSIYCVYIIPMIWIRYGISAALTLRMVGDLLRKSTELDRVDQSVFTSAISGHFNGLVVGKG